jgi:site-specific recombinase XerD
MGKSLDERGYYRYKECLEEAAKRAGGYSHLLRHAWGTELAAHGNFRDIQVMPGHVVSTAPEAMSIVTKKN